MASLLVLAPDIDEAKGLLSDFAGRGLLFEETQIGSLTCTSLPTLDMLVAVGGNGKSQYAVHAQYLIDRCAGTKLLVCVGAAGRLTDMIEIGDLVVATATVEHDYKERFNPESLPQHDADANGLGELIRVAGLTRFSFKVHFGLIASGDEDIVDPVRAAELRATTNALCVAWEGSANRALLDGLCSSTSALGGRAQETS